MRLLSEPSFRLLIVSRFDFLDMVQVKVGPDETVFTVPRSVLCNVSPFFDAGFSKSWKENEEKSMKLPESDPNIFSTFLHWAFTGQIELDVEESVPEDGMEDWTILFELYIMGDTFGSKRLKNQVMDRLDAVSEATDVLPGYWDIRDVYANVPSNAKLIEWLIDQMVYEADGSFFEPEAVLSMPNLYAEILQRYATRCRDGESMLLPEDRSKKCYYHEHDESTPECE